MGDETYKISENFFRLAVKSAAKYKVILSQECLQLVNLFYICNNELVFSLDLEDTIFSEEALLARVPDIAQEYMSSKAFPEILIADNILTDGRKINDFLNTLILNIHNNLKGKGCIESYKDIEKKLLESVNIITIVQSCSPLQLKMVYFQRLFTLGCEFYIWPQGRCDGLKDKITQIITNAPYVQLSA
jgi:hypothetical protein